MNYLHDKRTRKTRVSIAVFILGIVVLALIIFSSLPSRVGGASIAIFKPFWRAGSWIGGEFSSLHSYFKSKRSLDAENIFLKQSLSDDAAKLAALDAVVHENELLKTEFGRKPEKIETMIAGVLAAPDRTPYDTLVVDAGAREGARENALVFANGGAIGNVAEVYTRSSKVSLFSSPGISTDVIISGTDIHITATGRGGGNFEIQLPREVAVALGQSIVLPGLSAYPIGTVTDIVSDPRNPFQKILATSPINMQHLRLVEIELR